jgi:mannosyltransferase OCH1-like enzyme
MSYLTKKLDYKKIILNTKDASFVNTAKTEYIFSNLKPINVKEISFLKFDMIAGYVLPANIDKLFEIKVDNVDYNKACYYNSDKNGIPTIAHHSLNGKSSTHIGNIALELVPQDISSIKLIIKDQNSQGLDVNEDLIVSLIIEQIPEHY